MYNWQYPQFNLPSVLVTETTAPDREVRVSSPAASSRCQMYFRDQVQVVSFYICFSLHRRTFYDQLRCASLDGPTAPSRYGCF